MKRCPFPWLLVLALPLLTAGADKGGVTFYLQLIRGTDGDNPPTTEARPAGPALCRRLQMFKWKNYWEMAHRTVVLEAGGRTRQRMSAEREVEISLASPNEMTICIYADGKLTRRRKQSVETPFYIAGGDKDVAQSWFIVVRRDKPPWAQAGLK
jgi:hypothetical protein